MIVKFAAQRPFFQKINSSLQIVGLIGKNPDLRLPERLVSCLQSDQYQCSSPQFSFSSFSKLTLNVLLVLVVFSCDIVDNTKSFVSRNSVTNSESCFCKFYRSTERGVVRNCQGIVGIYGNRSLAKSTRIHHSTGNNVIQRV